MKPFWNVTTFLVKITEIPEFYWSFVSFKIDTINIPFKIHNTLRWSAESNFIFAVSFFLFPLAPMEALHHTTYLHHPLSIRKPMFYSNKPVLFLELNLISSLVPNFFWHVSRCHSSLCKNVPSQHRHQQCLKREAGHHLRRLWPLSFVCQKNVWECLSLGFRVQNLYTTLTRRI